MGNGLSVTQPSPLNGLVSEPYVVALVPAHNEEVQIEATIASLYHQTRIPDMTIVISDNSTDRTVAVVQQQMLRYPGLSVIETVDNTAKKAGALNAGIRKAPSGPGVFYCQMDADTIIDPTIIEEGLKEFASNPKLGGSCSRCGIKPLQHCSGFLKPTAVNKTLWYYQAVEYGFTDSRRADVEGKVKVMAGAFTMYRFEALQDVVRKYAIERNSFQVWDEESIVEDYTLTLDVRQLGWQALAGQHMRSWTDVPISFSGLWQQRRRWYRGSFDEVRKRKWQSIMRKQLALEVMLLCASMVRFLALAVIAWVAISPSRSFDWNGQMLIIASLSILLPWLSYIPNLQYLEHLSWRQKLLVLTVVPMHAYSMWDEFVWYFSAIESWLNRQMKWSAGGEV